MRIGNKEFQIGKRTYIMGILNITPDSFSDGGKFNNIVKALVHTSEMIKQGADIIDIGGESTRPNHLMVSEEEELERVIPVIKALRREFDIPISIDTYKAKVAEEGCNEGANLINDIWGFKKDPNMAKVAAKLGVPCCLMHNRDNKNYVNIMDEIIIDLKESISIALEAGVDPANLMIDPGIGFGKTYEHNLAVMREMELLCALGYPLLLGASRKSVIGNSLNLPFEERVEGTLATTVIGIMKGCDFIRVHDIYQNKRACVMTDAIFR